MSARTSEYSTFDKMPVENNSEENTTETSSTDHDLVAKTPVVEYSFGSGAWAVCITGPLNILLVCIPLAFCSKYLSWGDSYTFVLSLLALAPLAERLGFITEQLAIHTNDTIGGLLNATFGNATELIVAIAALYKGLFRLVQLSLLGSVLSNMLLVLGTAFFFGGLHSKTQYFGKISSQINSTLLMLSTCGVCLPTVLTLSGQETSIGELGFSRATSVILFIVYFAFLAFQLGTHRDAYEEKHEPKVVNTLQKSVSYNAASRDDAECGMRTSLLDLNRNEEEKVATREEQAEDSDDEDDDDEDVLGFTFGLVWLGIITVFIAFLSEFISGSIESGADSIGISAVFLAAIVLPIVGNAAEHAGAVMFAIKSKLDLSLGVAIGSSTQIALLVLPLLVLLGWISDLDMSLDFGAYESFCLLLSVITVTFAIKDGKSNWLLGVGLIAVYLVISIGFFADSDDELE